MTGGKKTAGAKRAVSGQATATARRTFLDVLAHSANVSEAARVADLSNATVYRLRQRDAEFRAAWQAALCEGYVRLEAQLLAEALTGASAKTSDAMLKSRQQKHRLGLALLTAHRAAVRGERAPAAPVVDDAKGAKARLRAKLASMAANGAANDGANEAQNEDGA